MPLVQSQAVAGRRCESFPHWYQRAGRRLNVIFPRRDFEGETMSAVGRRNPKSVDASGPLEIRDIVLSSDRLCIAPTRRSLAKSYGITAAMSLMAAVIPWAQSAKSTKAPNVIRPTSAAIGRPMASTGLERFAKNRLTS